MRVRTICAVLVFGSTTLLPSAAWSAAAPGCEPSVATRPQAGNYWALQRFGLDRLPAGTDGTGVTVAVLDSGVDASHPVLAGRVLPGVDELRNVAQGKQDCIGHGTAVASLIAGKVRGDFRGIAPGAKILPVRMSEKTRTDDDAKTASPAQYAAAIDFARQNGAKVINMSFAITTDEKGDPNADLDVVRAAIARAVDADIVIVAAAGNDYPKKHSYPAEYNGVIGVGAITPDGSRQAASMTGDFVKISAPGENVAVAWPGGGFAVQSGTSFAAPMVSGAAALIRSAHPHWTAKQVLAQLTGTADPSAGGPDSPSHGAGVVNPVRAVTETVASTGDRAYAAPPLPTPSIDTVGLAAAQAADDRRRTAYALAGIGALITLVVLFGGAVLARGRGRAWRTAD